MTAITYHPDAMSIEVFEQSQFVTQHGWTYGRDGNQNPVLHARFHANGGEFDGYAKPVDLASTQQVTLMLNEVTGWLLARASGLPCSPRAFFIPLPHAALPTYEGLGQLPLPDANGCIFCFVTESVSNTAIKGLYNTNELAKEQSAWAHCSAAIAFDEGIANTDRHVFNLLRRGAGDFVLIDHGYLLRRLDMDYPPYWNPGVLEVWTDHSFDNILHRNTQIVQGTRDVKEGVRACEQGIDFSEKLIRALRQCMFEISFWCSILLPGSSARWLKFLYERLQRPQLSDLLHRRYGLIPLYVQPTV